MAEYALLPDGEFARRMEDTVRPALEARGETLWLEREPGRKIYCLHYRSDCSRGVVVISHGFTESAEKFQEPAYYFVSMGYDVFVPDHCGHGHSYRLTEDLSLVHVDSYMRYVSDLLFVAELAQASQPELPLYLYGHSMGGGIAAAAAAAEPRRFQKIILTSPMIRPATAGIPWPVARAVTDLCCLFGKTEDYVMGQHAYTQLEQFEHSASLSEERFNWHRDIRHPEPLYHTNGASYGWLREAIRLSGWLQKEAWRRIEAPVLLFQAERETFVINREQERFVEKLNSGGAVCPAARLVRVPNSKHEIYNSRTEAQEPYWREIFAFLEE